MCAEPVRVGVLGGTFDPVHLGHLACAREIAEALCLDRVLLVLSARPPHKDQGKTAPVEQRWQMLRLAVAGVADGVLEACDLELRRSSASYTVDTLAELTRRDPGAELFLILGIDAYEEIDTWSRPGEILSFASIVVTSRPGRDFPQSPPLPPVAARTVARYDPAIGVYVHTSGHTVRACRIRGVEVSATDIRCRAGLGLPIEHLTGEAVARFITEHRLYGAPAAPSPATGVEAGTPGAGKHCKQ